MQNFLRVYKDYEGSNTKLIVYATELRWSKKLTGDLLARYDDMFALLLEELGEQPTKNEMYDSDTEHLLCQNELR